MHKDPLVQELEAALSRADQHIAHLALSLERASADLAKCRADNRALVNENAALKSSCSALSRDLSSLTLHLILSSPEAGSSQATTPPPDSASADPAPTPASTMQASPAAAVAPAHVEPTSVLLPADPASWVSTLRVADLKQELKTRGVPLHGRELKADLQRLLKQALLHPS